MCACGDGGAAGGTVTIDIEVPSLSALNPLAPAETSRLASFRLVRDSDGIAVAEQKFSPGAQLGLGTIAAGPPADYDLEGLSESGQILAFGRMHNLRVSASDDVSVSVKLRKPIGYVSGGAAVLVRDATKADADVAAPGTLDGAPNASAVTSTHEGDAVLLATGTRIQAFSTANHASMGSALVLPEPAETLVLSQVDGALAALGQTGLTLFNLSAGIGQPAMGETQQMPAPAAAVFSKDGTRLFVLTGQPGCSGGCAVRTLDAHGQPLGTLALPEYASDIAIDQASGAPVVALPGRGAMTWLNPAGTALTSTVVNVPGVELVASNGAALVGFAGGDTRSSTNCGAGAGSAGPPVAMVVLPGQAARRIELQIPEFTASFSTNPNSPNTLAAKITQARFTFHKAALTPDAGRALVWATADYFGDINIAAIGLPACTGTPQASDELVMLIDLSSGVAVSVAATKEQVIACKLDCTIFSLNCVATTKLPSQQFVPTGISILFGGR
jgi:hypothetical protein